jgi:hypothetical protein
VAVLREALTRDEHTRLVARGERITKGRVAQTVEAFIQNVHHFRDDGLRSATDAPSDHVVIFDESQRAWNLEMTRNFMKRRKGRADFSMSEPEFLLSYMDRHQEWATVVCLVGGGQEINTGEAGIGAWLTAVADHFPHWHVFLPATIDDSQYDASAGLAHVDQRAVVTRDKALHLATSMRSFRAERVSGFVQALLAGEVGGAQALLDEMQTRYPLALTRDLEVAKRWVRTRARGSERVGLVASSQAMRLKPHAIDVRVTVDPVHYFLSPPNDTRASSFLEDAATEFHIQGLELDWVCVSWDADLRRAGRAWRLDERSAATAPAVSRKCIPRTADTSPARDGDLYSAWRLR